MRYYAHHQSALFGCDEHFWAWEHYLFEAAAAAHHEWEGSLSRVDGFFVNYHFRSKYYPCSVKLKHIIIIIVFERGQRPSRSREITNQEGNVWRWTVIWRYRSKQGFESTVQSRCIFGMFLYKLQGRRWSQKCAMVAHFLNVMMLMTDEYRNFTEKNVSPLHHITNSYIDSLSQWIHVWKLADLVHEL